MKDLIIGCTTNYDWSKLKYWVNSINKSGFKGEKVMVAFNIDYETIKRLSGAGFQVILPGKSNDTTQRYEYQSSLPVHVERFVHIYNYLQSHDTYRFVITTDVKDVSLAWNCQVLS
jgi:ketopantoate hydroxymethyltransferase